MCPLIPDSSDTDTDAKENMVMSMKAAQKKACNIHDKLEQAIRTLHIKGIIQQLKQKSIHKKSFQQQMNFFFLSICFIFLFFMVFKKVFSGSDYQRNMKYEDTF